MPSNRKRARADSEDYDSPSARTKHDIDWILSQMKPTQHKYYLAKAALANPDVLAMLETWSQTQIRKRNKNFEAIQRVRLRRAAAPAPELELVPFVTDAIQSTQGAVTRLQNGTSNINTADIVPTATGLSSYVTKRNAIEAMRDIYETCMLVTRPDPAMDPGRPGNYFPTERDEDNDKRADPERGLIFTHHAFRDWYDNFTLPIFWTFTEKELGWLVVDGFRIKDVQDPGTPRMAAYPSAADYAALMGLPVRASTIPDIAWIDAFERTVWMALDLGVQDEYYLGIGQLVAPLEAAKERVRRAKAPAPARTVKAERQVQHEIIEISD